jgi:hypothetical protein
MAPRSSLGWTFPVGLSLLAYVVSAVVASGEASRWLWAAIPAHALALVAFEGSIAAREGATADELAAARSARAALMGVPIAAVGVLAAHLPASRAALHLGAAITSVAGLYAIERTPGLPGMFERANPRRTSGIAVGLASLAWIAAVVLAGLRALAPDRVREVAPTFEGLLGAVASLATMTLAVVAGYFGLERREHELGASDRLRAFVVLAAAAVALAVALGALRLVAPALALPVVATGVGILAVAVSATHSPETLGRAAARVVSLALLAAPPALATATIARFAEEHVTQIALAGAAVTAVAGFFAPRLAERAVPRIEPWRGAFESALESAMSPDADAALERALFALRGLAAGGNASPVVVRLAPPETLTVDRAGYPRREPASVPGAIESIAREEPAQLVRTLALAAAAVRRPEVRPAVEWLEERDLSALALLADEGEPIGWLGIPTAGRTAPISLPEARALRLLADRVAAAVATSGRIARSLAREADAAGKVTSLEERLARVGAERDVERGRGESLVRALAARVTRTAYSPSARIVLDRIESLAREGQPLALVVPPGVDPIGWIACHHVASPRHGGAIELVDARAPELADLALWRDPARSPLPRAVGGTLALLDPQALPRDAQRYLAVALPSGAGLACVVPRTVDALAAMGELDERLADLLGDRAVLVPPLASRSEDLRPLALEILNRTSLRHRGRVLGLAPAALEALAEHAWPGNEAELEGLLVTAALQAEGDTIALGDLRRAGLDAPAHLGEPAARGRRRATR